MFDLLGSRIDQKADRNSAELECHQCTLDTAIVQSLAIKTGCGAKKSMLTILIASKASNWTYIPFDDFLLDARK